MLLSEVKSAIIVGLDSGTWTAVAVLRLDGKLLALQSRKHWAHADLAAFLSPFCPITLVASDRNPASHAARRMAASYSAKLFRPARSLGVIEKTRTARDCGARNAHERDAYAAAKKAYDVLCANKFRNLDRRLGLRATHAVKARGGVRDAMGPGACFELNGQKLKNMVKVLSRRF